MEFDIQKYEKFLDKNPNLETNEHWARAKKTTYTLFNVLIDNDLTELVFVLEHFPHYVPLVCGHFRYSYGYSEKEADIEAASKLLSMGENYKTKQFMRNVLIKLPKLKNVGVDVAADILSKLDALGDGLHPAISNHYKKEFASWLDSSQLHPLQKITIKKKLEKIKEVEYDDLSSSDKDDGLNIPYLA